MHGEKVQRWMGAEGFSAERKAFAGVSDEPLAVGVAASDGPREDFGGGGVDLVRCGRASHGAGRSRKMASAFGL